jgi:hypothetical protein
MVLSRKLERARRDALCHCGWPRAYTATSVCSRPGRPPIVRIRALCELHGVAFATRWRVEIPEERKNP